MAKSLREALKVVTESKPYKEIDAELKHMGRHGAHELAAALFNGSAFVMYPKNKNGQESVEDPQHGLPQEAQTEQKEQSHGMEI